MSVSIFHDLFVDVFEYPVGNNIVVKNTFSEELYAESV